LNARYIRAGMIGNARCYLLEAAPMWEAAKKVMKRKPLFFVDRISGLLSKKER